MDRLSIVMTLMTGAVITGALVVTFFTLGYIGWIPIGIAAVVGWVAAWPAAYVISRRIKSQDRNWHRDTSEVDGPIPKLNEKEV